MDTEQGMEAMEQSELRRFAQQKGLYLNYIDAWGEERVIADATLQSLLDVQGYSLSQQDCVDRKQAENKLSMVQSAGIEPVIVQRENQAMQISLSVSASARISDFSWHLETEQGQQYSGQVSDTLLSDNRSTSCMVMFAIPQMLACGYHQLKVMRKRRKKPYQACLIVTPEQSYQTEAQIQGGKLWGTSVQLYGIKSQQNWGIGDFGDLRYLIEKTAKQGADFIGLNPLHALFPAYPENKSPYSPSSRTYLNTIYIDVPAIDEFATTPAAQQLCQSAAFQAELRQLRQQQWVDYRGVMTAKLKVLRLLFDAFQTHETAKCGREQEFNTFVQQGGDSLRKQATFDALHAYFYQQDDGVYSASQFPEEYHDFNCPAVQAFIAEYPEEIKFYSYLQWIAQSQLAQAQALAVKSGMEIGIYQDLAVGVDPGGADVWANPEAYPSSASIGAPPDVLAPMGQDWGLTTFMPEQIQQHAYYHFIRLLRENMQTCGALRIDHILGLMRLWWIPQGQPSAQGGYIGYPHQDLLAIIALESHRNKCVVVGEDLGTVPENFREALSKWGVLSYKVFLYNTSEDGGYYSPNHYEEKSLAVVCTHDMPTLVGFWHCEDLKLADSLSLYPNQQMVEELFKRRLSNKQNILNSLHWHGVLSDSIGSDAVWVPMDRELNHAIHVHLAKGNTSLMSVQLEECLEMETPVNVPGTFNEYPNWQRKLSMNLEEMFSLPEVSRMFSAINQSRNMASLNHCFEQACLCK